MRYVSDFQQTRPGAQDVAMTPMIDVVFMLLIFFVWTASFRIPELILPSSLVSQNAGQGSVAQDPELIDLERIVVRIVWQNDQPGWQVNQQVVGSLALVRQQLIEVAAITSTLPVLVDPQPVVPLGHVIDVYDAARMAGFDNVQFATPEL